MTEEMKAGRELDALVAERVMGIRVTEDQGDYWPPARPGSNFSTQPIRHYSTRIADAWEVADKIGLFTTKYQVLAHDGNNWVVCEEVNPAGTWGVMGMGATAPEAIARAALKAVGVV